MYKKQIDSLRKNRKLILDNLDQICDDMMHLDKDELDVLLYEHREYTWMLKDTERKIESLQPWWRKFLGIKY